MYNFDTERFQVLGISDVVLCTSYQEAQRIVTSHIAERMEMIGLTDSYEFDVELIKVRTPLLVEHQSADDGENELASENEFWNFAYKFDVYARKVNATE